MRYDEAYSNNARPDTSRRESYSRATDSKEASCFLDLRIYRPQIARRNLSDHR